MSIRPGLSVPLLRVAGLLLFAGAMLFFVKAATEHARVVNNFKARGDQSGYLMDAKNVYFNFHGQRPKALIGERNRMPLYAGYLALFYNPSISDPEFFEVGKRANIYLAVALLMVLGIVSWWHLPPLPAINLLGIAMFGWFVYKAGYTQSELLFYTLFFLAFLACWHLLRMKATGRTALLAALAGGLSALAYLTKASTPPFLALFAVTFAARAIAKWKTMPRSTRSAAAAWSALSLAVFAVVLLAMLSPYLATNKRTFGRYFYNVNSTFYVWYDDFASALLGVMRHGDGLHWPDMPESELPSASRYWREHTVKQMAERVSIGLKDMAVVSYRTYDYLSYLLLYSAMLVAMAATRWAVFSRTILDHAGLTLFLFAYGVLYALATAFYYPTSGTGTGRFIIAHLLPYFFVLTHLFSRSRLANVRWSLGPLGISPSHFHLLIFAWLVADVSFRTWPRVMTTYGGF